MFEGTKLCKEDLGIVCRLCLSKEGDRVPIFGLKGGQLSSIINDFGFTEVSETDELPKDICRSCLEAIESFSKFRDKCRESELALKNLMAAREAIEANDSGHECCDNNWDDRGDSTEPHQDESTESGDKASVTKCGGNGPVVLNSANGKSRSQTPLLLRCNQCPKLCNSHSSLHYHRLKHSGLKPHQCSHCPKTFHQKCTLVKHERVHTGERPYACDQCGKTFSQRSNLKFHMTSHSGEKVFCCDVCGKGFTLGHNLKEHLKIHSGCRERSFACQLCDKSFYHGSHLRVHLKSHTGDRPFSCETCGKTFVKRSYLKQHNRVHTGERPYKCPLCPKAFANSSNLSAHRRWHSGETDGHQRRHTCPACPTAFRHKSALSAHLEEAHPCREAVDSS